MDPDKIELESINKMFEYEKFSRLIDELDVDELKSFAIFLRDCAVFRWV